MKIKDLKTVMNRALVTWVCCVYILSSGPMDLVGVPTIIVEVGKERIF